MLSSFPPRNLSPELYQLHHLFALSSVGRQLVPFLRKLGLNCTEPTKNPAQGTVSTLIFFENVYLELLCFDEISNLTQFDMNAEFNFLARVNWLETGASPFGFGLSYPATNNDNFEIATVKEVETDKISRFLANSEEPICYVVPNYVAIRNRLDRVFATTEQIAPQTMGMRQLTPLLEQFEELALSLAARTLKAIKLIKIGATRGDRTRVNTVRISIISSPPAPLPERGEILAQIIY